MTADEFKRIRGVLSRFLDALSKLVQANGHRPLPGSAAESDLKAFASSQAMHTAHSQAWMLVEVTADQLSAFLKTVTEPVETIAPYTCVRSLLEAAALSTWLIEPDLDPHRRVARSLALRYEGMKQQVKWARSAGEDHSKAESRLEDIANSARSSGFPPVLSRQGEVIGAGVPMPSVTELIRDRLDHEALYRLLSAVAHGHHWALVRLSFAHDVSQTPTSAITGQSLVWMAKEPNLIVMEMLAIESALALARVAWYQALYLGWDRRAVEAILEAHFDEFGAKSTVRFWRASA